MCVSSVAFAQIEPTTRCNFTCGFCAGRALPQGDLSLDTFDAALTALPDLKHVELQGEGESLLHPDFFTMVERLRARGIKVSLISNGSLISPTVATRILDAGIEKISVSIESADEGEFKRIRGGKLDKVIRNLEHFMAERGRRGLERPVIGFSVTVLASTREARHDIYALYDRLGLDGGISLQPLQSMDVYARNYGAAMQDERLGDVDADKVLARFFSDPVLRRIESTRAAVKGFYDELSEGWSAGGRTCPYLDRGLYVHRTGEVTACCMMKDTAKDALGRIGETPLADMVARRDALKAELATGHVPGACAGCSLARFSVMSKPALLWFAVRGLRDRVFSL